MWRKFWTATIIFELFTLWYPDHRYNITILQCNTKNGVHLTCITFLFISTTCRVDLETNFYCLAGPIFYPRMFCDFVLGNKVHLRLFCYKFPFQKLEGCTSKIWHLINPYNDTALNPTQRVFTQRGDFYSKAKTHLLKV